MLTTTGAVGSWGRRPNWYSMSTKSRAKIRMHGMSGTKQSVNNVADYDLLPCISSVTLAKSIDKSGRKEHVTCTYLSIQRYLHLTIAAVKATTKMLEPTVNATSKAMICCTVPTCTRTVGGTMARASTAMMF